MPSGVEPPLPSASGGDEQPAPRQITVATTADPARARRAARALARAVDLDQEATECVALATTELATNLLRYARRGVISLASVTGDLGTGVQVVSQDEGPGIANVSRALEDGYSTGGGLGNGLPGVRRLMDTFELSSGPQGTRIETCKWPTRR